MTANKMINPTEKDIGRKVTYTTYNKKEFGVITSFNDICVFVKYGSNTGSQATDREDLTWSYPKQ